MLDSTLNYDFGVCPHCSAEMTGVWVSRCISTKSLDNYKMSDVTDMGKDLSVVKCPACYHLEKPKSKYPIKELA